MIGNAVTVPVAKWLGERLMQPYRSALASTHYTEVHAA